MKQLMIPPLLVDIVQSSISVFDRVVFDSLEACPACGGPVTGYDSRKKQFAVILKEGKPFPVNVFVKRFSCRQCGIICFADEPFYPDTRIGSPVVDLCRTLSMTIPFHRTSAYLARIGIIVDRGTVRNYSQRSFPEIPTTDLFGVRLPLSVISLSSITTAAEGSRVIGAEALAACGFPSAYRAAPDRPGFSEQGDERKEKEQEEKWQSESP